LKDLSKGGNTVDKKENIVEVTEDAVIVRGDFEITER
jgi:hypothetical protein